MDNVDLDAQTPPRVLLPPPSSGKAPPLRDPDPGWVRVALAFYAALCLIAVAWVAIRGGPLFYASEQAPAAPSNWLGDALLGALLGACFVVCSRQISIRTRGGERTARALAAALGPLSWRTCLALALASAIGEEVFFRGLLQPRIGLIAASLLFGAAHFVPQRELALWTLSSLLAGFALGFLFEHTGNLVAPVTAHLAINASNLRWLSVRYGPGDTRQSPRPPLSPR